MKKGKYAKYFLTEPELINKPKIPMTNPSVFVDSAHHFGAKANFSMGWRYLTKGNSGRRFYAYSYRSF